jgi:hypothetical protein
MTSYDKRDSVMATGSVPRRPRRLLVLASATGACFTVLFAIFCAWALRAWRDGNADLGNRFPHGILADYVPEDSAAVLVVNVHQLRESLIVQPHLKPLLQQLIKQAESRLPWLDSTGINLLDDLDNLLISFASNGSGEPVLLAQGRLDCSRFQVGPDQLQAKPLDGFRVWEYKDQSSKQNTLLVVVGDTLVVSNARGRVQTALKQASDPQPSRVRDARLAQLLRKVDRRQCFWLAASIKRLGPVSEIDNYLLKLLLRPLLAHCESAYGGITCTEVLQAELHFGTARDEDAAQLETDLKSICETALGLVILDRKDELLPLLRLLASGQVRREGRTILLRCRLGDDALSGQ